MISNMTWIGDKSRRSVVLSKLQVSFRFESEIHAVGHSPVLNNIIFLQTEVRKAVMPYSPALINSAGIYSNPADFLIYSALIAASASSCRIGRDSIWYICDVKYC